MLYCFLFGVYFDCQKARERDATGGEKRLGMEMANILKKIINPYFLRRTKAQISQKEMDGERNKNETSKKSLRSHRIGVKITSFLIFTNS